MFRCPRCKRRCAIVVEMHGIVGCRRCFELNYRNAYLGVIPRLWKKRERLEAKIAVLQAELDEVDRRLFLGN